MKRKPLIVKLLALVSASFSFLVIRKYLQEKYSTQQNDLYLNDFSGHEKILLETSSTSDNSQMGIEHPEDDLKQIDGIGPKYEAVLKNSGVNSFQHLSTLKTEEIETLLRKADIHIINCATWVEQAKNFISD